MEVEFHFPGEQVNVWPLDGQKGRPRSQDAVMHVQWEMYGGASYLGAITFMDVSGAIETAYFAGAGGRTAIAIKVYWSEDAKDRTRHVHLWGIITHVQYQIVDDGVQLTMNFGPLASTSSLSSDLDQQDEFTYTSSEGASAYDIFMRFAEKYDWVTDDPDTGMPTAYKDANPLPVNFNMSYNPQIMRKTKAGKDVRITPSQYFASLNGKFVTSDKRSYEYRCEPTINGIVHYFHPRGWDTMYGFDRVVVASTYEYRGKNEGDVISASADSSYTTAAYLSGANAKFAYFDSIEGITRTVHANEVLADVLPQGDQLPLLPRAPITAVFVDKRTSAEALATIADKVDQLRRAMFTIDLTVVGDPAVRPMRAIRYRHWLPSGTGEHFVSGIYRVLAVMNSVDTQGWSTTIQATKLGMANVSGQLDATTSTGKEGAIPGTKPAAKPSVSAAPEQVVKMAAVDASEGRTDF